MSAAAYTGLGVEGGTRLGCVCVSGWGDKAVMDECNQLTHVRHMHPCTFLGWAVVGWEHDRADRQRLLNHTEQTAAVCAQIGNRIIKSPQSYGKYMRTSVTSGIQYLRSAQFRNLRNLEIALQATNAGWEGLGTKLVYVPVAIRFNCLFAQSRDCMHTCHFCTILRLHRDCALMLRNLLIAKCLAQSQDWHAISGFLECAENGVQYRVFTLKCLKRIA